jgi:hypothetical protein
MNNFYINATTKKFDYLDSETGLITSSVANSLIPIEINMYYILSNNKNPCI